MNPQTRLSRVSSSSVQRSKFWGKQQLCRIGVVGGYQAGWRHGCGTWSKGDGVAYTRTPSK